jgi:hypothetical protein
MKTVKSIRELTAADVSARYSYEPATGALTPVSTAREPFMSDYGYLTVSLYGRTCAVHRLAWLLSYGAWPDKVIDHIDGDKLNNRLANLRDATAAENQQNRHRPSRRNSSGHLGVSWCRYRKRWHAQLTVNGERRLSKFFDDLASAVAAYAEAKREHHVTSTYADRL